MAAPNAISPQGLDPGMLRALSESIESATLAISRADIVGFEAEIARQQRLLTRISGNSFEGNGDLSDCALERHELFAALAHNVAVLACALRRSLRTLVAMRALMATSDGTYSALERRV